MSHHDPVEGLFRITPHPPGVVETCITRNGDTNQLTLDPPGVADDQQWFVGEFEGSKGVYLMHISIPPAEGFSWEDEDPKPGSPVLFGEPKPFFLTKVEGGARPIYRIQPGIIIAGAAYYVGHNANKVQFMDFPITDKPPPEAPMWRFTSVE